jgi:hypothetical protein
MKTTKPLSGIFAIAALAIRRHFIKRRSCELIALPVFCVFLNFTTFGQPAVMQTATNLANGHVYYLLQSSTWTAAEGAAVSLGGHLATIRSQAEQDWVWNQWGSVGNLWIGLHDPITGDGGGAQHLADFIWTSGETPGYNGFYPGEPNGPDDYTAMNAGLYAGQWNDAPNNYGGTYGVAEVTALPIIITKDLTNIYVLHGSNTTLSVTATGTSQLSYQWYFVPATNSGQAGAYSQIVSGFCVAAVVTNGGFGYGKAPNITFVGGGGSGAGGNATVSNGAVSGITITNAGNGYTNPPAVVIGAPNGFFYGQTNSTLNITNANENNLGTYFLVITDGSHTLTSSVVSLTLLFPPGILTNPVGFVGSLNSSNVLSVAASGTQPLSYQWMLNGTNLPFFTDSNYLIANLTLDKAGSYSVRVTNAYGATVSSAALVALSPTLTSPFAGAVDIWGQDAVFNVGAIGSGSLSYQWYFNGQAIDGATNSSHEFSSIQFTNAGLYNVIVSSQYGSVTNTAYQVVVNPADVSIGIFAGVIIQGTIGYNYNIQSTTNLANPNSWTTLTNITLTSPAQIWNDNSTDVHNTGNPQKYFRVLPGQ